MREPFVVYPGRRRFALLLALSVALVALGVVGVIADAASVFAWICICLFGTGVFVFSRELLRRRPYLVVDDEGIWGRSLPRKLRWEEIAEIGPTQVHVRGSTTHFIGVTPHDPELVSRGSFWRGLVARGNEMTGGYPIDLPISHLQLDHERVWAEVAQRAGGRIAA